MTEVKEKYQVTLTKEAKEKVLKNLIEEVKLLRGDITKIQNRLARLATELETLVSS